MIYGTGYNAGLGEIGLANFIPLKKGQSADQFLTTYGLAIDNQDEVSKYFFKDNIFATQVDVLADDFIFKIGQIDNDFKISRIFQLTHPQMIENLDYAYCKALGMVGPDKTNWSKVGIDPSINPFTKFRDNYRFGLYKVGGDEWKSTLKYRRLLGYIDDVTEKEEMNSITDDNPLYFWWFPDSFAYYRADNYAYQGVPFTEVSKEDGPYASPNWETGDGNYLSVYDFSEEIYSIGLYLPIECLSTLGHFEPRSEHFRTGGYPPTDHDQYPILQGSDTGGQSIMCHVEGLPSNLTTKWINLAGMSFDGAILKYVNYGSLMNPGYLSPRIKHITPESANVIADRVKSAAVGFKYLKGSNASAFTQARLDSDFNAIDDIQNVAQNLGLNLDSESLSNALLQLERISFVPDEWSCEGTRYTGSGTRQTLCEIFRRCKLYASGSIRNIPISDINVDLTASNGTVTMVVTTRDGTTLTIKNQMDGVKNCEYNNDGTIIFCVFYLSVGSSLIGTLIDISEEALFRTNVKITNGVSATSLDFDKSGISMATTSPFRLRKFLTKGH